MVALKLGMTMPMLFPYEMVVLATNTAIAAVPLIRWLLWLPVVPVIAAVLCIYDLVPIRILSATYLIVIISVAAGWNRAAAEASRGGLMGDTGSMASGRMRRTPSQPSVP